MNVVLRAVHTLSTTTERTENNKCSAVAHVDGQARTLLLTRGPHSTWRLSALPTQRTFALQEMSVQHFQKVRTRPSRYTSAVAAQLKPDMFGSPHEQKNNLD